jgi:hypothetical protein
MRAVSLLGKILPVSLHPASPKRCRPNAEIASGNSTAGQDTSPPSTGGRDLRAPRAAERGELK